MPNPIKYNTSAETLALKKGNFWIGTGDVGKGPTSSTGFYNGISPSTGGFTIYLNKASGGPSIYTVSNEAQLTALTNSISVLTNLIKNNNGGNFADGTIAPFNGSYGTMPTVVDITNDKPYNGSTSTKAAKFLSDGGMLIYTDPSPFTMTVGVTYTFSFWYRQTSSKQFYIGFNNQGGSGDMNGNFQAYSASGYFPNPTQTWQRCSWTFTNVVNKPYFFIYRTSADAGAECLMTEFTLTEGSMPGGPGLTTSGNCLNWFATQTDKMIFNVDYPPIVTSGLTLNIDAGFSPSFATIPPNANSSTVTPWYDLGPNGKNGSLINGPTFNSANGGSIVFDGVDDKWSVSNITPGTQSFTVECFFKYKSHSLYLPTVLGAGDYWQGGSQVFWGFGQNASQGAYYFQLRYDQDKNATLLNSGMVDDTIYHFVGTRTISGNQQIIKSYKNGSIVETSSPTYIYDLSSKTTLTNQQYVYTGPPPANIYNIKVYNRDLSATEILQNYYASIPIIRTNLILNLEAGNPLSYTNGSTTWIDTSGNGYNFTLRNGVSAGTYNNITCLSFDGSDDNARWVDTSGFRQDIGTECTISIWMNGNGTSLGQTCCRLISFNSNVDINEDYNTYFCMAACNTIGYLPCYRGSTSGGLCAGGSGSNYQMYTTDFKLVTVSWSTITDQIDVYLNNTNIFNASLTAAPFNYSEIKRIALASNAGNLEYSNIRISSMQMYSKKLSVSELTQNYNAQKGRFGL